MEEARVVRVFVAGFDADSFGTRQGEVRVDMLEPFRDEGGYGVWVMEVKEKCEVGVRIGRGVEDDGGEDVVVRGWVGEGARLFDPSKGEVGWLDVEEPVVVGG